MNAFAGNYLSIAAVGDIMMGTTYPEEKLPPNDGVGIFDNVKKAFRGNNIIFGNLEGPLIDGGTSTKCKEGSNKCFAFRTPKRYGAYLKEVGFNVLSIANNHAHDFGVEGIMSTVNVLRNAGIYPIGGKAVAHFTIQNKKIVVVGFSYSSASHYSYSIQNIAEAGKIVSTLKESHDIVIVSFHGGAEGESALHISDQDERFLGEQRGNVMRFSRSVIDAGADMVIGHGPHVLRALELYKGKLIVYSLGNFLTYERFKIDGPNGLSVILKARLDVGTGLFVDGELIPVKLLHGGIPEIDQERQAIDLIKGITEKDINNSNIVISDVGTVHPITKREDSIVFIEKMSSAEK